MNHFGFLFSELWRYSRASHSPENRLNAIVFECIRNVVGGIFCHNDWLKRWRCQNVFCYLQLQFPIDKIYSFVYSFTKSILFSHRKFIKHLPTIYQIIDGHRSQILYWQIWKTWILQRQLEESSRDQIPQLRLILSHLVMDASKFFSPNVWLSMIHHGTQMIWHIFWNFRIDTDVCPMIYQHLSQNNTNQKLSNLNFRGTKCQNKSLSTHKTVFI